MAYIEPAPLLDKENPFEAMMSRFQTASQLLGLEEQIYNVLKVPARLTSLADVMKELETFTDAAWWNADVDELSFCELHEKAGALTADERTKLRQGDFHFRLFGDHRFRLVLLDDPCYQVGYSGSVGFLLNREGGKVYVTKVLEGYYSRVDNSVDIDFASTNGELIIEIVTVNSMPPEITNYYFTIDPRTHKAVPRNLFKEGKKLTNQIYSEMIIGELSDLGLPNYAKDTVVVRNGRLLPTIYIYSETYTEARGRKFERMPYRWNGKYYAPVGRRRNR